jgi:hypothetical protein
LALAPALAHSLELPNKIDLSREDYLTIQQGYRGWALLGFVVVRALLSNLVFNDHGPDKAKGFCVDSDCLSLHIGNTDSVLDLYIFCQPRNWKLDNVVCKLA